MVQWISADSVAPDAYLPTPKPYKYRSKELAGLVGYERIDPKEAPGAAPWERMRYHDALSLVNRDMHLGMDATDLQMMTMIYNMLSQTNRFGADTRIDAAQGENPATHSLQCLPMLDDVILRSGVAHGSETAMLRQIAGLGLLIHDSGEILGEFNTVAQRAEGMTLNEDPDAERRILEHALGLAMQAIEAGNPQQFYDEILRLREEGGIQKNGVPVGITKDKASLDALLQPAPVVSAAGQARVDSWMGIWRMTEYQQTPPHAEGRFGPFVGWLVKSVEHAQGTRHLLRMARRDHYARDHAALLEPQAEMRSSMREGSWNLMMGNQSYNEGELGALLHFAETPAQQAIGRAQAQLVYGNSVEMIELSPIPFTVDYPRPEHKPGIVLEMAAEAAAALGAFTMQHARRAQAEMAAQAKGFWVGIYDLARTQVARGLFTPKLLPSGKGQVLLSGEITREMVDGAPLLSLKSINPLPTPAELPGIEHLSPSVSFARSA